MTNMIAAALIAMLPSIAQIESNGQDNTITMEKYYSKAFTNELLCAVGRYQITQDYLEDVNRIGHSSFKRGDRFNERRARIMVITYLNYWGRRANANSMSFEQACETLARIHNGGPNGYRNGNTANYWDKIRSDMVNRGYFASLK